MMLPIVNLSNLYLLRITIAAHDGSVVEVVQLRLGLSLSVQYPSPEPPRELLAHLETGVAPGGDAEDIVELLYGKVVVSIARSMLEAWSKGRPASLYSPRVCAASSPAGLQTGQYMDQTKWYEWLHHLQKKIMKKAKTSSLSVRMSGKADPADGSLTIEPCVEPMHNDKVSQLTAAKNTFDGNEPKYTLRREEREHSRERDGQN